MKLKFFNIVLCLLGFFCCLDCLMSMFFNLSSNVFELLFISIPSLFLGLLFDILFNISKGCVKK